MNAVEIKTEFNKVIANVADAKVVAELELLREYFTNPSFRANLESYTAKINGVA